MNIFQLTGRLVRDVQVKMGNQGDVPYTYATLAVANPFGEGTFYPVILVRGKNAEFLRTYAKKGTVLEIIGHITTLRKGDGEEAKTTIYLQGDKISFGISTTKENNNNESEKTYDKKNKTQKSKKQYNNNNENMSKNVSDDDEELFL